jgi:phosphatidylcholine synthase
VRDLPDQLGQRRALTITRVYAYAIHVLTASGAAFALLALILAVGEQWTVMFLCLGFALIVDGVDGPLARVFKVAETAPRFSGDTLDLVVDFTTYVFVPAYALVASGLLPPSVAILCGVVIVVTGALYFADREMKTADNHFRGFPAVWNLIAFYLFVLAPPSWIAAFVIAVFAALTFAPLEFVHPLRVKRWRGVTVALMVLWAILAAIAVFNNLAPGLLVTVGLSLIALYFLMIGIIARRPWTS